MPALTTRAVYTTVATEDGVVMVFLMPSMFISWSACMCCSHSVPLQLFQST